MLAKKQIKKSSATAAAPAKASSASMVIEMMDPAKLVPYDRNPRHNLQTIDKVVSSIREFGWRQPIVVDSELVVVAGHTRLMAAQRMGLKLVPVHIARDLTPDQVKAYRLADNRTAEESDWDKELLSFEIKDLMNSDFDTALTGFNSIELDDLFVERTGAGHRSPDPDAAPDKPSKPRTRPGEVWLLGPHRLRCGDARRLDDIRAATNNRLVDIIWTDPPYNVDYVDKTKDRLKIKNDKMGVDDFQAFLLQVMRNYFKMAKDGAPIYVAHADTEGLAFRSSFVHAGFKLSGCLIWRKDSMVLGRSDYQWQHEPVLYGWKPGKSHNWYGGRAQVTFRDLEDEGIFTKLADGTWQVALGNKILTIKGDAKLEELLPSIIDEKRPQRNKVHPTMKPTALIERMLNNSAKPGALVLDCFGGSGSTLIAAERCGMKAALVELDPAYCDVIVDRWQEYSGQVAHREGDAHEVPAARVKRKKATAVAPTVRSSDISDGDDLSRQLGSNFTL